MSALKTLIGHAILVHAYTAQPIVLIVPDGSLCNDHMAPRPLGREVQNAGYSPAAIGRFPCSGLPSLDRASKDDNRAQLRSFIARARAKRTRTRIHTLALGAVMCTVCTLARRLRSRVVGANRSTASGAGARPPLDPARCSNSPSLRYGVSDFFCSNQKTLNPRIAGAVLFGFKA